MAIIVQKYGGSSVADVDKIQQVADKVVQTVKQGHLVVVVVSAMAKTTDGLLELAHNAATVQGKHQAPARRELDMLVTTGERVSMALLSIAIQARGIDAISFTGSQCGILTNHRHFDARIIEVRAHRVEDELALGRVVIVAGYQGVSYKREITTLGRGGSDTTAVALAAALGAERCEIYSDVDGVYSADPRVVPQAQHIAEMDAELLQQMAQSGAKVLNEQAVEWARRQGIAIYARASFGPTRNDGTPERETIVRSNPPSEDNRVRAITCDNHVAHVTLEPLDNASHRFDISSAVEAIAVAQLPLRHLSISHRGGSFILPLDNLPEEDQLEKTLTQLLPDMRVTVDAQAATVSVIGYGLSRDAELMGDMVRTLVQGGIEPIETGASALRLYATVRREQAASAQRLLHRQFVES